MAGRKATVGGSIGADGSLDYAVNTEVDAGAVGQQVNQLLASVTGDQAKAASSKINLHFNVGGTYDKPQINLAGSTSADGTTTTVKEQVKQEVKQEAQKQVDVAKKEAEAKVQEETQKVIEEGEKQLQQQADTLKKEITKNLEEEAGKVVGEQLDSTATELKESLKSLFKKKKKN
jgi:flagellar motor protein MotB